MTWSIAFTCLLSAPRGRPKVSTEGSGGNFWIREVWITWSHLSQVGSSWARAEAGSQWSRSPSLKEIHAGLGTDRSKWCQQSSGCLGCGAKGAEGGTWQEKTPRTMCLAPHGTHISLPLPPTPPTSSAPSCPWAPSPLPPFPLASSLSDYKQPLIW